MSFYLNGTKVMSLRQGGSGGNDDIVVVKATFEKDISDLSGETQIYKLSKTYQEIKSLLQDNKVVIFTMYDEIGHNCKIKDFIYDVIYDENDDSYTLDMPSFNDYGMVPSDAEDELQIFIGNM